MHAPHNWFLFIYEGFCLFVIFVILYECVMAINHRRNEQQIEKDFLAGKIPTLRNNIEKEKG